MEYTKTRIMNKKEPKSLRAWLDETILFAILIVALIAALLAALIVLLVRQARKWKQFRALLKEWAEDREKREKQESP